MVPLGPYTNGSHLMLLPCILNLVRSENYSSHTPGSPFSSILLLQTPFIKMADHFWRFIISDWTTKVCLRHTFSGHTVLLEHKQPCALTIVWLHTKSTGQFQQGWQIIAHYSSLFMFIIPSPIEQELQGSQLEIETSLEPIDPMHFLPESG